MTLVATGQTAPDFTLSRLEGKSYSLKDATAKGLALVVFYKDTCPTCQFTLPFIERIHKAYNDKGLKVLGIEQDDPSRTAAFSAQYGLTFPVMAETGSYEVSNSYGISIVPTLFLVDKGGKLLYSGEGFVKTELAELSKLIAQKLGITDFEVFQPGEYVPAMKAG